MLDPLFCIVGSYAVIKFAWRSFRKRRPKRLVQSEVPNIVINKKGDDTQQKDIKELKRQGYTDELIAVILPTINNGK